MSSEAEAYDSAFQRRAPKLSVRAERDSDRAFLAELFIRCSPLRDMLPRPLLEMQAHAQQSSHFAQNPEAMRRIVCAEADPVGRIVVDWHRGDHSYGVDIAVLPEARATGAGLHMLRAWLDVADGLARPCQLDVLRDNPAERLYRQLGFVPAAPDDAGSPFIAMRRLVRAPAV